ncbi:hypothetical protein JCM10908_004293 [Rhodotorula pacifica]|uniref:uncharacterized protein n=1 Tax=Rhodotorula pacifica TaxID=1495444 RepID=UPI003172366B
MARGKGTPRRNRELAGDDDDDMSPVSRSPSNAINSPRRTANAAAAATSSPSRLALSHTGNPAAPEKPTRGPLPPSAETTYHQRLRQILVDHRKARRAWNELVIRGLIGRTRAVLELWVDVELALKAIDKQKTTASGNVRAGYLFAQSAKLSEQIAAVEAVFANLEDIVSNMQAICERVEYLVIEAAKTRGTVFAFREALWVTWPLARFADGIHSLSMPYIQSLALVRSLLDTLLTFPPLPSSSASTAPSTEPVPHTKTPAAEPAKVRPSNEEIQAAMSLLAVQPLLPGKASDWGNEGWEEVMAVEVGGWER